jgi:hypothetical protein
VLVSAGLAHFFRGQPIARRLRVFAIAITALLAHSIAYLWVKKYAQYVVRTAPTEALMEFSQRQSGNITIKCLPYGEAGALDALRIGARRPFRP